MDKKNGQANRKTNHKMEKQREKQQQRPQIVEAAGVPERASPLPPVAPILTSIVSHSRFPTSTGMAGPLPRGAARGSL